MRVGLGFDIHPLVYGRRLIIGGVEIEYEKGLSGHSDADVLTHAIMDALLGAGALGDIGELFPANNKKFKDISSMTLLDKVIELLNKKGLKVENIDAVIICQQPRLSLYIKNMIENLAHHLKIDFKRINIKAKSTEGINLFSNTEAISAFAVAMISSS